MFPSIPDWSAPGHPDEPDTESPWEDRGLSIRIPTPHAPPRRRYSWCSLMVAGCTAWTLLIVVMAVATRLVEVANTPPAPPPLKPAPVVAPDRGIAPVAKAAPAAPAEPVAPAVVAAPAAPVEKPAVCAANLGTAIQFVKDPPEAFRQARDEKKLVFMIHLAGNFEDKAFT
jgi:hypothetical protein